MDKKTEALKLALEALEKMGRVMKQSPDTEKAIAAIREALADSALDRMADNAKELGLDYEPPCKTGGQCTSKCPQCEQPNIAKYLEKDNSEQPAQKQEPVAYSYTSRITGAQGFSHHPMPRFIDAESWDIKPLYTFPPASKPEDK